MKQLKLNPVLATLLILPYLFFSVGLLVGAWLYLLLLLAGIAGLVALRRRMVPPSAEKQKAGPALCGYAVLVGVGHSLCAVALVYFLLQFQAPAFDESTVEMLSSPLTMLGLALAAPILEEYLYRGVILESYRRYLPFWAAAGLSALLFAVSHLNWQQGIHAFLLGLWTAYLCRRTGRMLYPVLAHMTNNCLSGLASIAATLLTQVLPLPVAIVLLLAAGGVLVAVGLRGTDRCCRALETAHPDAPIAPPDSQS